MKILTLFKNDMRRLIKEVGVFVGLLLMPLVIILPNIMSADFTAAGEEKGTKGTPLVVADYDGGEVAADYIQELSDNFLIEQNFTGAVLAKYELQTDPRCIQPSPACAEAIGRARLADGSLSGVLVIPEGLTAAFKNGQQTDVALLFDPGGDSLLATQIEKISQGLAIKVALTRQIEGAKGDFTDLGSLSDPQVQGEIDKIVNQPTIKSDGKTAIHVEEVYPTSYTEKKELGLVEQALPQISVLFVFLFPSFLTGWVREEQASGLFRRLLSTPMTKIHLIASKLLFGVFVCALQIMIIFAIGILASSFKGYSVTMDFASFLLLTLALSAASTSTGLLIASTRLPASIAIVPMLIGGALGGSILNPDFMPAFMVPFSMLVPQRYGVVGYMDLIGRSGNLLSILPETGILLLFTLLFASIAIWRFDLLD